ncbi:rhodanese-like domain-containing protein [Alicyclobacillus cycloheptanicus]|uniref:Rhodanese-related sulfurtransferase n=1 Tax=Alicyclobacillus cycloheptanicus TaxID=1457 RepID=A0ABT9XE54_9BACL|nr:rhodanese-like domain-containing protein [Alicyclobacillus cycloheptanicus]MDQ0188462.1 rhodanese-related sulfurtransferase [Alicyclobacillus cycloheptanicus]
MDLTNPHAACQDTFAGYPFENEVTHVPRELDGIPQYSWEEVRRLVSEGAYQWIDVRTPEEYEEGHVPGIPLKPMQEVTDWMGELDKNQHYVFVCRSGGRSQKVAQFLKANGFMHVANCEGGTLAWPGELNVGKEP